MNEKKAKPKVAKGKPGEFPDAECLDLMAALMAKDPTPAERVREYLDQVKALRAGLREACGFGEEENITALILAFFDLEALR